MPGDKKKPPCKRKYTRKIAATRVMTVTTFLHPRNPYTRRKRAAPDLALQLSCLMVTREIKVSNGQAESLISLHVLYSTHILLVIFKAEYSKPFCT